MIQIPNKIIPPLCKANLESLNSRHSQPLNKHTVNRLNQEAGSAGAVSQGTQQTGTAPAPVRRQQTRHSSALVRTQPTRAVPRSDQRPQPCQYLAQTGALKLPEIAVPPMRHLLRRGQKTQLDSLHQSVNDLKVCFGWNILDARCDMDASAFLLTSTGKVPSDDWFVFYGQTSCPGNSVSFGHDERGIDREIIRVRLNKLHSSIQKVVFVLTINEAFKHCLNFSMMKDVYVRLLDGRTDQEIVSYRLEDYSPTITSMTIGELYLHNGQWKFNPVGNGLHQDLAGQCAVYGVEIG